MPVEPGIERVTVSVEGDEDADLDATLGEVREILLNGPAQTAERARAEETPEGAKSTGALLSSLVVGAFTGAIPQLVSVMSSWTRARQRRCEVTIQVADATLRFPEMSADEAMALLRDHGIGGEAGASSTDGER